MPGTGIAGALAVVIGASQGIGASIALALVEHGAQVVLAARDADRLEQVGLAARGQGAVLGVAPVDVSSVDSIREFSAAVLAQHGTPRILVNSAGHSVTKPALHISEDEWDRVHDVNLKGTFFVCQAFGAAMSEVGYGKIINLSSTWAATAGAGRAVYCAAKAGVSHLTAALAVEWAPAGVRVNAIAPTATRTPRVADRFARDPDREAYLRDRIPLGRLAEPKDVAGAAVFLAGEQSDFVTGHTLFVDGGWRAAK